MKLILQGKDFDHICDVSCYNNNYYKHKETGIIIFEECDEFYNTNKYTDVTDPNNEYFLGFSSCLDGRGLSHDENVEIEFKVYWT